MYRVEGVVTLHYGYNVQSLWFGEGGAFAFVYKLYNIHISGFLRNEVFIYGGKHALFGGDKMFRESLKRHIVRYDDIVLIVKYL